MAHKLYEFLKSGNFTLVYHDNQACTLYKGKLKDTDEINDKTKVIIEYGGSSEGYTPDEVEDLVKALGGKVLSF